MSFLSRPKFVTSIIRWFDAHAVDHKPTSKEHHHIDWVQSAPFFIMHLMVCGYSNPFSPAECENDFLGPPV